MGTNKNFNYRKAEADLFDVGVRHPEDVHDYSNEKSLRGYMQEHGLNPDKYFSTPKQEGKSKDSSPCYLTTACVKARRLPDQCMELQTLRAFRDDVLAHRPGGLMEIEQYYQMAPDIVAQINQRKDAVEIWNRVYDELVSPCVQLIQESRNEEAFQLYKTYSLALGEQYNN